MSNGSNGGSLAKKTGETVRDLITANMSEIAKLVPKVASPDRLLKVLLGAIAKTPALQNCTPASLIHSFKVAAELGLEPGGALGHLYLVPYGEVATPIVGYRGLIELMRRTGQLKSIRCVVVHAKDAFRFKEGIEQQLEHEPTLDDETGDLTRVYCVAHLMSGGVHVEVMTKGQVDKIRARSKASSKGPWVTDYEEMAKKTVLRRAAKYLPMSAELSRAFESDDEEYVDGEVVTPAQAHAASAAIGSATDRAKDKVREKLAANGVSAEEAAELRAKETAQAELGAEG